MPPRLRDACLLAFGTDDPEKPPNKKLMTKDEWLCFQIWRFLAERGWGRAPTEVNIEVTNKNVSRYTPQELARLTLEQISAIWREQIAPPAALADQSGANGD
jgi:hypothetical protein